MKNYFSKLSKQLALLAFVVFAMAISFGSTSNATGAKVTNLIQTDSGENYFKLSYDAPLGTRKFDIYISESASFPANGTIKKTTYSSKNVKIYDLNPNRTYYVKVIPVSPEAEYSFSDTLACVTNPEDIEGVKHTQSTISSITVTWNEPLSGAQYYNIYYKPTSSSIDPVYAGSTTSKYFTIQKLLDDTDYNIYVYPVKKSAAGYEAVGYVDYKTNVPTVAKANKISQAHLYSWTPDSTTANIHFKNNQKAQNGIEVEISSLAGKKITTLKLGHYATSVNFSLSKIKNKGFQYRFRYYVTTDTKNCYGPWSNKKTAIPFAKVSVKKHSSDSLRISWKKVAGATSYSVYVAKTKDDKFKKVATVKSTKYILKKVKKNQEYYIYIKANGVKCGNKKYSSTKPESQNIVHISTRGSLLYVWSHILKN